MKAKIFLTLSLIIFIGTAAAISTLPFAQAANWETVKTITGSSDQTTSTFSISAGEWRIQWSYRPDPEFPEYTIFAFYAYPEGETASYVDFLYATKDTQTSGIEYIHQGKGNYYLNILDANAPSYTITIQQDQVTSPTNTIPSSTNTSNASTTGIPILGLVELLFIIILVVLIVVFLVRRRKPHATVVQSQTMPPPP